MKKLFTLFAAMFAVVAMNAQTVDYSLDGFYDGTSVISTLKLGMTEDFNPSVILTNNGPDVPAATDSIILDITIEGMNLGYVYLLGAQAASLTAGNQTALGSETPLFTAAEMDEAGIEGSFQFCYNLRIVGAATDPDLSNNQACLTVNRGVNGIENIVAGEINVYPNPATDVIYVANAEGAQVSVFDMNGRMVNSVESASANQAIDASSLAKGMYIVRIVDGQNVTTKKVNVVR